MGQRVLTLTTLGTPHKGTAFADWAVGRFARVARPILDLIGMPYQGFYDLTTASCRRFNDEVRDDQGVRYYSVAAKHNGHWLSPEWLLPYHIVLKAEGPNDGVVSVASATYGEPMELWSGDHFSLVNWSSLNHVTRRSSRCAAQLYQSILARLEAEGY
jgi:triacylglycerol lipase